MIEVSELTVMWLAAIACAAFEPKSTAVAPVNPVPVMVTEVPPPGGPVLGLIPVTIGPSV